jgi:hypothetical protein
MVLVEFGKAEPKGEMEAVGGKPTTCGDREMVVRRKAGAPGVGTEGDVAGGASLRSSPADEEGDGVVRCGAIIYLFIYFFAIASGVWSK